MVGWVFFASDQLSGPEDVTGELEFWSLDTHDAFIPWNFSRYAMYPNIDLDK